MTKGDYVKDVLKLPQLSISFKAAETEICFTQAVAIWEVRPTRLGSFTYFLMADSSSNAHSQHGCISLRASVSPVQLMIIQTLGLRQHLIKHQTYCSQTCPLFFCIYSLAFFVTKKFLLDLSYCLQLYFSAAFCRISCHTSPMTVD